MPSDELSSSTKDPKVQWEGLEKRVNSLLEGIVKLRNANGQLMKENIQLKNQLKDAGAGSSGTVKENPTDYSQELLKLRKQYDEAIQDLKQVKNNLGRIEALSKELKLEG